MNSSQFQGYKILAAEGKVLLFFFFFPTYEEKKNQYKWTTQLELVNYFRVSP